MFDTDLSKIRELSYRDVGAEEREVNLRGLIGNAFSVYYQRYLSGGRRGHPRIFKYESDSKQDTLDLQIVPIRGSPGLSSIEISSPNFDFRFLLSNLRGKLKADFPDFSIDSLGPNQKAKIARRRDGNYSQLGVFHLSFSLDPKEPWKISGAALQVYKENKALEDLNLEILELTPEIVDFLSFASLIKITNSSYEEGDSNKSLIHENSILTRQGKRWHCQYRLNMPNNGSLPAYVLPSIENLFSDIEGKFSASAFNKIKILEA